MNIENIGVRVTNPEQRISLDGKAFFNIIRFEHLRAANLQRCVDALRAGNPHGSEQLAEIEAMVNASAGMLKEHMRVAIEQGLRFEIVPSLGDLH